MAQATLVSDGRIADHTPAGDISAGDVVLQSSLFGIASQAIAATKLGSIITDGIFDVVKITGGVSAGAPIFWDPTGNPVVGVAGTGACTVTQAALKLMGWAVEAAASGAATARVKLANVVGSAIVGAVTQPIADPGDAGAIPVTSEGHVALSSGGGGETRTLADPTIPGQQLLLYFIDDGGAITLTAASAVNQTGNNTLLFEDIGDVIHLIAIEDAPASFEWRVVHNDGITLSTV